MRIKATLQKAYTDDGQFIKPPSEGLYIVRRCKPDGEPSVGIAYWLPDADAFVHALELTVRYRHITHYVRIAGITLWDD